MLSLLLVAAVLVASLLTATLVAAAERANVAHAEARARLREDGGFGR